MLRLFQPREAAVHEAELPQPLTAPVPRQMRLPLVECGLLAQRPQGPPGPRGLPAGAGAQPQRAGVANIPCTPVAVEEEQNHLASAQRVDAQLMHSRGLSAPVTTLVHKPYTLAAPMRAGAQSVQNHAPSALLPTRCAWSTIASIFAWYCRSAHAHSH